MFRTVEAGALLLLEPERAVLVADDMLGPFLEQAFAMKPRTLSGDADVEVDLRRAEVSERDQRIDADDA